MGTKPKDVLDASKDYLLEEKEEVEVRKIGGRELDVFVTLLRSEEDEDSVDAHALIDSGATLSLIDQHFVERYNIPTHTYSVSRPVFLADGSKNEAGRISKYVDIPMIFNSHREIIRLAVTSLASSNIFLGHDWLSKHNPEIDWKLGTICFTRCPPSCTFLKDDNEDDDVQIRSSSSWPDYLKEYADVFSEENYDKLPESRPWDHAIDLKPDFKPSDCKVYPLNPKEQIALKDFLKENLANGRIRNSKSPMASPFFFIKKEDGSLRAIQDYRKLNTGTVKNKYPLPLIQELVDKVKNAKFITKLDVRSGYYNIRIKEGDEWKAAFRTNEGLFEPTVMFFGLTNAPATFQAFMNDIFRVMIREGKIIIYLDDILIFSKDLEEHRHLVRRVMEILRKNKLYLKPSKCEFATDHVKYLGHIIGNGCMKVDPKKSAAVKEWPAPKNVHELQQFLGFGNWLRRFIKDYSSIVKPLTSLTGKAGWMWGDDQQQAFDTLKEHLCNPPILVIPNLLQAPKRYCLQSLSA